MMSTATTISLPVNKSLFDRMLAPYKEHCRYLKNVRVEAADVRGLTGRDGTSCLVRAVGEFRIPEPCYIDSTGHLNSVEVNICYNQLLYVILGQSIASGVIPALQPFSLEHYCERHLPDVLIYDLHVAFRRPIDSQFFHGEISITRAVISERSVKVYTHLVFWDGQGGEAQGDISVAILLPHSG